MNLTALVRESNRISAAAAGLRVFRARLDEKGCCLRVSGLQQSLELRTKLVASWREKLGVVMCCEQARAKARLHSAEGLLRVLGPQATLERGYSITLDERGGILRSVADAHAGQRVITRLHDGELSSTIA